MGIMAAFVIESMALFAINDTAACIRKLALNRWSSNLPFDAKERVLILLNDFSGVHCLKMNKQCTMKRLASKKKR